jgi:hypothetical protein
MRFLSTAPSIPEELLDRFGKPEHVFGPNRRFRVSAAACGVVFLVMGVTFFLLGRSGIPLADGASGLLTVPLLALGGVVLIGTVRGPRNWVFVCPGGLLRTLGSAWHSVGWTEVMRFEDATWTHKMVTTRSCRILLKGGAEWGFMADSFGEYNRLMEVLRRKADEWRTKSGPRESS